MFVYLLLYIRKCKSAKENMYASKIGKFVWSKHWLHCIPVLLLLFLFFFVQITQLKVQWYQVSTQILGTMHRLIYFFLYKLCCNARMIVNIIFHVFYATLYIYGYVKPNVHTFRFMPTIRFMHSMRFLLQVTQNTFYANSIYFWSAVVLK